MDRKKTIFDSLAVVKKFRHHLLDENGNPINFNFGYWHKISQDLPKYYEVTWAAFIMSRSMLNQTYYPIGRRPYLYETKAPLVDIDNESDFEVASILYNPLQTKWKCSCSTLDKTFIQSSFLALYALLHFCTFF